MIIAEAPALFLKLAVFGSNPEIDPAELNITGDYGQAFRPLSRKICRKVKKVLLEFISKKIGIKSAIPLLA